MRRVQISVVALVVLVLTGISLAQAPTTRPARSPAAGDASKFLRFVSDEQGGGKLQTSIVTYRNAEGVTVDLVGAVHIGDASYYQALNERFGDYESVLFEMVRPRAAQGPATRPGATPAPAVRRGGGLRWIGVMQRFMRDHLELEHQLEAIDYDRDNFVHADLDVETFMEMQAERGESVMTLMMQAMLRELGRGSGAAAANQASMFELLNALQAPDRARQLKLVLARQLQQMDDLLAGIEGPRGSVILTERNRAAMRVLDERVEMGERRLAIFYGAGHFTGMEKILTEELGFEQTGEPRWITAWDLTTPPAEPEPAPLR